jgi:hypothetical protein
LDQFSTTLLITVFVEPKDSATVTGSSKTYVIRC